MPLGHCPSIDSRSTIDPTVHALSVTGADVGESRKFLVDPLCPFPSFLHQKPLRPRKSTSTTTPKPNQHHKLLLDTEMTPTNTTEPTAVNSAGAVRPIIRPILRPVLRPGRQPSSKPAPGTPPFPGAYVSPQQPEPIQRSPEEEQRLEAYRLRQERELREEDEFWFSPTNAQKRQMEIEAKQRQEEEQEREAWRQKTQALLRKRLRNERSLEQLVDARAGLEAVEAHQRELDARRGPPPPLFHPCP
ncbi:unnamed protein product [Parajaminaea phylloscopi]